MSMLADRKVKQKWSLNPRGKAWSEDANKFGQKMLERMGWAPGKGLGAKEDGIKEHVKVAHKSDSKGVGYKETNDQWTEHDSNFNSLLQSLSGGGNTGDVKFSSLEQKSQSSRARVHYKKFTRGKDLSRCSEKDLACIFGRKTLKEAPKVEEEKVGETSEGFGVRGGSMLDYFKNKLPKFKKSYVVGSNGVLKKESEDEDEGYSGFGFKRKNEWGDEAAVKKVKTDVDGFCNRAFDPLSSSAVEVKKHSLNTIEEEEEEENSLTIESEDFVKKEKKRKKAKLSNNKEELSVNESSITEGFVSKKKQQLDESSVKTRKKMKKEEISMDNPTFNESSAKEDFVDNNYEVKRNKKKREEKSVDNKKNGELPIDEESFEVKRKKNNEEISIDNPTFNETSTKEDFVDSNYEVKRKKKKREGKSVDNLERRKNGELSIDNSTYDESFEVKRKKSNEEISIDNPTFNETSTKEDFVDGSYEVKRKKKKREDKLVDNSERKKNGELSVDNSTYEESFEVKRKKGNEEISIDNPTFDETSTKDDFVDSSYEVKRKKKKRDDKSERLKNGELSVNNSTCEENFEVKRKKKKNEEISIDNPTFNESSSREDFVDSNYEVKRKKKKREGKTLDNSAFNEDPNEKKKSNEALSEESFEVKRNEVDYEVKRKKKNEEPVDSPKEENETFDLMLNITSTPSQPRANSTTITSAKRRKSVRFSNVHEERIIPNNAEQDELFQINESVINDSLKVEAISRKIDGFQMEIENDINEAKAVNYVGEVGNPGGENEKLPTGTRLKFKYAKLGRSPAWMERKGSSSKSSYRHLIKGDIIVGFRNTNLHEIGGYAVRLE